MHEEFSVYFNKVDGAVMLIIMVLYTASVLQESSRSVSSSSTQHKHTTTLSCLSVLNQRQHGDRHCEADWLHLQPAGRHRPGDTLMNMVVSVLVTTEAERLNRLNMAEDARQR